MFNQSNGASNSNNGADTSVYPPQPYAPIQSSQPSTVSSNTSPSTSAGKTIKSDGATDATSTSSGVVNGLSRKRNASDSPGNEGKEKKAKGEGEDGSNSSPGTKSAKSSSNGAPNDVRAWGEEAAK